MTKYFGTKELLKPPTERAAFSDRQAYVCAELSKLAYFKFEGGHSLDDALELVQGIVGDDERFDILREQLRVVLGKEPGTASEGRTALAKILDEVGFHLVEVFDEENTQAFLCTKKVKHESGTEKKVAFLSFRGTEPRAFGDIKTDAKAKLIPVQLDGETVEFHEGYWQGFLAVRPKIETAISSTRCDQLFLTGHSLGGALAIVTTRVLASNATGACYTFGAPPVGSVSVSNKLKTPVYEIINEIDIVPRLPNPWMVWFVLLLFRLARLLAKVFSVAESILASGTWDEKLEVFIEAMVRYRHPGYVSYLVGAGDSARLRYNVSSYNRFRWWGSMIWKMKLIRFKKMVSDHSIDIYIAKLSAHAMSRRK